MIKVLITLCLPVLILSWWEVGHMLTAAIAEMRLNQLDPRISVEFRQLTLAMNSLCNNKTRTFIESAVWPDDIKEKQYNMGIWNEWHFVDTPFVTDAIMPVINYTEAAMTSVITVEQARTALKANVKKITAERALFARYLIHMVGDIHQPLHSVSLFNMTFPKGDAGGNFLKIQDLSGTVQNFHAFWDSGAFRLQNDSYNFVRPMNLQNTTQLKRIASSMIETYGKSIQGLASNIHPSEWAKESFLIAQNTTYPFMMKNTVATEQYTNLVHETSKRRITLAGYRLANFVIDCYNNPTTKGSILDQDEKNKLQNQFMQHAQSNKGNLKSFIQILKNFNLKSQ